jgi:NAD(P)-dependent dehydrogenase (short-subunit alcohol dehydrogenase family)
MDLNLNNKVVLITGGSKGIGLACARGFLAEGARVAITSRNKDNLEAAKASVTSDGYGVFTHAANLVDPNAAINLASTVESALGPIDILVNSAGDAQRATPQELSAMHWRAAMDAKYFTYIHAMDATLEGMVTRKRGAIVSILGAGGKVASPIHLPGGAANAALMLVTAGLANAWGHAGIRINAINPGPTLTGRRQVSLEVESRLTGKQIEELRRNQTAQIPLGRYARPEEIADAVLYLSSERASYVTGIILTMDGALVPMVV